jgi:naphthalene 1,2-dioxygenase ferredoxin reductase component
VNYRIHVTNTDQTIDCPESTTILVAAVNAGIDFPYGCASGNCGLCMCKIGDGKFEMLPYADGAFGPVQEARGLTLACRAMPRSHLEVSWLARPNFD